MRYNRPMTPPESGPPESVPPESVPPELPQQRPLVGVGVVFRRGDSVFLAQRRGALGGATWGSAGGHLEFGESLEDCARREAREELGLAVGELRFLCVANIVAYGRHYLDVEFLGDIGRICPAP